MELLIVLLVLVVAVYVGYYILGKMELPAEMKQLATIILGVIFLILLLNVVGVPMGFSVYHRGAF